MNPENSPLLHIPTQFSSTNYVYYSICRCVNSKSALVALFLNSSVLMAYNFIFNINSLVKLQSPGAIALANIIIGIIILFSVLAGLITDVKYGRYKTILHSLIIIPLMFGLLPLPLAGGIYAFHTLKIPINYINIIIASMVFLYFTLLLIIFIMFIINGIQFGMDQLHDCSTQDSILYIHWYVWINYFSVLISTLPWILIFYDSAYFRYLDELKITGYVLWGLLFLCIVFMLILSMYIIYRKRSWFLIEQSRVNPYRLLYQVIRFAWRHKTPVYRSAFTYCEDELPSGLDLAKTKYGGPFTTEQVEDVKAFGGILKILLILGPVFVLQLVLEVTMSVFSDHGINYVNNNTNGNYKHTIHLEGPAQHITLSSGLLSPLLVVICIPLYLRLIRPRILYHIPGMMKRIGIAILIMILSLCVALAMDVVVHIRNKNTRCMLFLYTHEYYKGRKFSKGYPSPLYQNVYFFVAEGLLIALSNMTFDIGVLEFISSQSPYLMKGLLFGTFFAVRSLFQVTAILLIIPFSLSWKLAPLSCGSGFYLINIAIGLVVFVVYVCVAKRYKYRERDEPSREYQYAEEYYSNIQ